MDWVHYEASEVSVAVAWKVKQSLTVRLVLTGTDGTFAGSFLGWRISITRPFGGHQIGRSLPGPLRKTACAAGKSDKRHYHFNVNLAEKPDMDFF
jgi:hypothetical protein